MMNIIPTINAIVSKTSLVLLAIILTASAALAQNKDQARGIQAGSAYSISDIENVNLSNGNLMLNIPLASLPGGRGTSPPFTVALRYDSKLWDTTREDRADGTNNELGLNYSRELLKKGEHAGWKLDTGGYVLILRNRMDTEPEKDCNGPNSLGEAAFVQNGYIYRLEMRLPDGSIKEFRPYGTGSGYNDLYNNGYFEISPNNHRTHYDYHVGGGTTCSTTDYNDTADMNYYAADGSGMRLVIPHNANDHWKLFKPDGTLIENLPTDDSSLYQRQTDRNGNTIVWKDGSFGGYSGLKILNDAGQFVLVSGGNIVQPGFDGEPIVTTLAWETIWVYRNYQTTVASNANTGYIYETISDSFYVVSSITLPSQLGSRQYTFTYNGAEEEQTGDNFTDGFGEMKSVELPSGATSTYTYQLDDPEKIPASCTFAPTCSGVADGLVLFNSVTQRDLTYDLEYDGSTTPTTETTLYDIDPAGNGSTVTTPDGGVTTQNGGGLGTGAAYTESVIRPDGSKTENIWAQNIAAKLTGHTSAYGITAVNAFVKTEFTSVKDAGGAYTLTAIKDYDYDKNGNVLEVREYDWVAYGDVPRSSGRPTGVPGGATLKRKTVNTYYNPTPISTDTTTDDTDIYANPSSPKLHNVIKSTEVRDGSNVVKSRQEFIYDDASNTGNLIETRVWDSTKGAVSDPLTSGNWIKTSATYDSYGNTLTTTDANGIITQITYGYVAGPSGNVTGLYPTQTIVAYGTPLARTTTAVYDFYTGVVTSTTDEDNDVTNATEFDDLGRPVKSITAQGTALESWTQTLYNDALRRIIVKSDLETKGDYKKVAIQHFDQLGRVRLSRTLEDASAEDPTDEEDGIKTQTRYRVHSGSPSGSNGDYTLTSNPFRAATSSAASSEETMGWTVGFESKSGNLKTTEFFAGAALPSLWGSNTNSTGKSEETEDANATTTTDEAGKVRRTIEDALGRLIRVDEPNGGGVLGAVSSPNQATEYSYDTLGNLTQIVQGGQTRTFTYSSGSRLLSANNPESGTFAFTYDNNGNLLSKTDARSVSATFTYDVLNRVTFRNYSDSTPDVTYIYDDGAVAFSKGKLTKVASSVSESLITSYDAQDRITGSQQKTDGETYSFAYTYNLDDDLLTQTYPSGKVVEFDYDAGGDLAQVAKSNGFVYANAFDYSPHGQVKEFRFGNGFWERTQFNSRRQITEISLGHSPGDSSVWKTAYEYGDWQSTTLDTTKNNNSLARQTITVPTIAPVTGFTAVQTYTYDSLDRLKSAAETISSTQTWKQTFNYDRFGNRNFDTGNSTLISNESSVGKVADPEVLTSNNRFKLDQDNDSVNDYGYDSSGNLTFNAKGHTSTFNAENLQITTTGSGLSMAYSYDGNNKRIKSYDAVNDQTTIFVYDASGKLSAEYTVNVDPPDVPVISYLTEDALGSVRVVTNSFWETKSRRDYLPFGEEIYAGIANRTTSQKFSSAKQTSTTRKNDLSKGCRESG